MNVCSIVFVHGLEGHQIRTWTHEASGKTWISDPQFLGSLKDKARVLAFGYNANVLHHVTIARVVNHASDLLNKLVVKRKDCHVMLVTCLSWKDVDSWRTGKTYRFRLS